MDWFFEIIVLLGTFCVIAIGMTIYARINPTRPRFRRSNYVYIGIIPTITISSADSPTKRSPTTLTPADSVEEDERKSDTSATPVDDAESVLQSGKSENNRLSIPIDDDDDDEEEEQQQSVQSEDTCAPVSLPLVDNEEENKNKSQPIRLTSSPVENVEKDKDHSQAISILKADANIKEDEDHLQAISMSTLDEDVKEDKDNSQAINMPSTSFEFVNILEQDKSISLAAALVEDEKENEQHSKTALLFDKSDDEDHSQTASLSAVDSVEDDHSQSMDLSEFDDLSSSPILSKIDNSSGIHPNENKSLCKIGTSHTVEEPLFPFSEILEEQNPSTRNRFKKRLSQ